MTTDEQITSIRNGQYPCGCQAVGAVAFLLAELDAAHEQLQKYEDAARYPGDDQRHRGASVASQLVHAQHMREKAEAELDAARAREQQLEASLHSLCCAVCREPGAKGWCQSCFDRACKEVDQARGAWAREAKLREALKAVVNGNDIAAERNHSIEAWPGSPIRRQACAALAEGEDTRG